VTQSIELTWAPCPSVVHSLAPDTPYSLCPDPGGAVVYAVGDIHGRLDMLQAIHRAIEADAVQRTGPFKIIYLGDYVSRGPDSKGVLDCLMAQSMPGFAMHYLKGNHEDIMLRFLDGDLIWGRHWLNYGGMEALASFGVTAVTADIADDERMESLRHQFRERVTASQSKFLRSLEIIRREGDYRFVHGGVDPDKPLAAQSENDMIWIRDKFLDSDRDFGAVIVHGHCISPEPTVRHNRIGIDTGAARDMALTCLVVDGTERGFFTARRRRC